MHTDHTVLPRISVKSVRSVSSVYSFPAKGRRTLFAYAAPAELGRKLDVLKRHCEAVGRPYDEIERTALRQIQIGAGGMSASDLIALCRQLANVGIQHFIFSMANVHEITPLEVIGREVIPAVAEF